VVFKADYNEIELQI